MGVVNVTPDSFSDGGLYLDPERAIAHGRELAEAGAEILDVGGESTRPGAEPVGGEEELLVVEDLKIAKNFVDAALTELAQGKPVSRTTARPYGCSVKYLY